MEEDMRNHRFREENRGRWNIKKERQERGRSDDSNSTPRSIRIVRVLE